MADNLGGGAETGAQASPEPFPWDLHVFDAHCHPTDTMPLVASIPHMKARLLTVMATRSQDQDLVSDLADQLGLQDADAPLMPGDEASSSPSSSSHAKVLPCFGWHPWFSYQLYDDFSSTAAGEKPALSRAAHYDQVLSPAPSTKDPSFTGKMPDPTPLSAFLDETRARLRRHPLALVGEVGLDKAFRLPETWTSSDEAQRNEELTPGGREGRRLSPYRVQMAHQITILQAQLRLAGEMGRAVSVHGVQAHGILYDTLAGCWKGHEKKVMSKRQRKQVAPGAEDFSSSEDEEEGGRFGRRAPRTSGKKEVGEAPKPYPPRICLHSYSGPVDQVKLYTQATVPAKVFFSFSTAVNWGTAGAKKTEEVIRTLPDNRILAESDLHTAGEPMDDHLEDVCRKICAIKGWGLRAGVEQLARNWVEFALGR